MRKIHISESQLEKLVNEMKSKVNEADIDITPDKGESLSQKITNVKTDPNASQLLSNGRATINGDAIKNNQFTMEEGYKTFTKRQLKEARKQKLFKESIAFSKKEFSERFK